MKKNKSDVDSDGGETGSGPGTGTGTAAKSNAKSGSTAAASKPLTVAEELALELSAMKAAPQKAKTQFSSIQTVSLRCPQSQHLCFLLLPLSFFCFFVLFSGTCCQQLA